MRAGQRVALWIYDCPDPQKSVEERHTEIVHGMMKLESPLGWQGLTPPAVPVRKKGSFASFYGLKYSGTRISHEGTYHIRDPKYIYNDKTCDDNFAFYMTSHNIHVDYRSVLHEYFPDVIAAIKGYRAGAYLDSFLSEYSVLHQTAINDLGERCGLDVNGRNNIFTLNPAHYWDAGLCQRALGYGRDDVIRRLEGKVPLVRPLMDGVYVVFNDNPDLTFEEFCAVNDQFKPILGLV